MEQSKIIVRVATSAVENVPNLLNSYAYKYAGVARVFSPQPDLLIIDMGQNGSGQNATTYAANLVTIANGVGAKKTLIMGDESGYQTTACQNAATTLGANAAYGTPAVVAAGASVGNTGPTTDSGDGIHPLAAIHRSALKPALMIRAYPLLYGSSTISPRPVKGGPVHK